jgi:hypothetical protein
MQVIGKVFICEPWAREIVQNRKTIETAHISLPVRFAGFWLHVQNEQREIIGAVKFKGFKRYHAVEPFDDDFKRHRVMINSPYHYLNRKRCFGWLVDDAVVFDEPLKAQPMKSQFRLETY